MQKRLFVYGTLCPGKPNEHVLTDIGGTWQKASVTGFLKEKGWGAKMGSPGIVLNSEGQEVQGYIFVSEKLEHHWTELDVFEGSEYQRVLTQVKTEEGVLLDAFIYVLQSSI